MEQDTQTSLFGMVTRSTVDKIINFKTKQELAQNNTKSLSAIMQSCMSTTAFPNKKLIFFISPSTPPFLTQSSPKKEPTQKGG